MHHVFTSGRDYRPSVFWANLLPPNTVYVRVVAVADTIAQAENLLHDRLLSVYAETLTEAHPTDLPACAVLRQAQKCRPDDPSVYLIYRLDADESGEKFPAKRIHAARVAEHDVEAAERIRVVGMGRPTDPGPVVRVVPDDGANDVVPLPDRVEGPGVPLVSPAVAYPPGRLGDTVRLAEDRLDRGIRTVRDRLTELLGELEQARVATDPRDACERGSDRMLNLAQDLSGLHAEAFLIETALRMGN